MLPKKHAVLSACLVVVVGCVYFWPRPKSPSSVFTAQAVSIPDPQRIVPFYKVAAVMPGGRIVKLVTESASIRDSWRIAPLDPVVQIAGITATVEADRIITANGEIRAIPKSARSIEIAEQNGRLSVSADGVFLR